MRLVTAKDLVWAAWSPTATLVYSHGQVETAAQVLSHNIDADWRFFSKFYRWDDETLLLRVGDRRGTSLFEAKRDEPFQPVKDWPDVLVSLPPNEIIPGRNGDVAGMGPSRHLTVWKRGQSSNVYTLPEGFTVTDLEWDRRNRLWICGAGPTDQLKSLKYRRAFAVSKDDGSWSISEIVHGGFKVSWRSLLSGAEETYRKINLVNDYVVLSAETDDLENISTFLFVKDAHGKWESGTLDGDVLRAVLPAPNGGVEIISHYGQSVLIRPGEKWHHRSLVPRINKVIQGVNARTLHKTRYEILDAQVAFSGELVLVVSLRLPKENQLLRAGEAVVILGDETDRLITFHNEEEPEIITAGGLQWTRA